MSAPEDAWAIVPAKSFAGAKSRLAPALDAEARSELARSMLTHVLDALQRSGVVSGVLVATDGRDVERACAERPIVLVRDRGEDGGQLGRVIDHALASVAARGGRAALVLMGDLPHLAPDDVRALVAALASADIALAPDRSDAGTNAIALRLPAPMPTELGRPDSFERHLTAAERLGLTTAVVRTPGLAHDVDSPADL